MNDLLLYANSGDQMIKHLVLGSIVLGVLATVLLVYDGYRINKRIQAAQRPADATDGIGGYPSLFRCHDDDSSVLLVDDEVVDAITNQVLERLTDSERWLVLWYRKEKADGLVGLRIPGTATLADRPQDEVCREFRAMQEAPTLEDPDL